MDAPNTLANGYGDWSTVCEKNRRNVGIYLALEHDCRGHGERGDMET